MNLQKFAKSTQKRQVPIVAKNAERERSRVKSLRNAFHSLQCCLPSVPPDTKLSKLDILILATNYIAQLSESLGENEPYTEQSSSHASDNSPVCEATNLNLWTHRSHRYLKFYHPIKKWPMRSRLYSSNATGSPVSRTVDSELAYQNSNQNEFYGYVPMSDECFDQIHITQSQSSLSPPQYDQYPFPETSRILNYSSLI